MIGAAHAGWKGAFGGVIEATLAAMEKLGADRGRIAAAIGPVIARKSYEVDEAFLRRFAEADPENERFFSPGREGHHQFDLEAYVLARLAARRRDPRRGARPRHLCRSRPLLQLPPRHPSRRADLWPADLADRLMTNWTLYGVRGWGSTLAEGALAWTSTPYEFVSVESFDSPGPARDKLLAVNPLARIPTWSRPTARC